MNQSTEVGQVKLSREVQLEVCKRHAAFEASSDIQAWLKREHDIDLTLASILYYKDSEKWQDQYQRYRAAWQAETKDMYRLANVSGRMSELEKLYGDIYQEYRQALKEQDDTAIRSARRQLKDTLMQIQTELPGSEVSGAGGVVNINLPDFVQEGLGIKKDKGE